MEYTLCAVHPRNVTWVYNEKTCLEKQKNQVCALRPVYRYLNITTRNCKAANDRLLMWIEWVGMADTIHDTKKIKNLLMAC